MSKELLIVNKDLLPKCYEKVLAVKKLVQENPLYNVSKACKKYGISRSTYYKYQDYIFPYEEKNEAKKLVISFNLIHEKGALSKICDKLAKLDISILTISQSIPIDNQAPVMISLDISYMKISIKQFEKEMTKLIELSQFRIMSFQ